MAVAMPFFACGIIGILCVKNEMLRKTAGKRFRQAMMNSEQT
jgi:hypothetical protein